jgi:menaquinone-dependent protoporphyrinogen oxidase
MKPVLVLYATREGHTRRVADYLTAALRTHNLVTHTIDVSSIRAGFPLDEYSAAILTASVHGSRHESEMIQFVKLHRAELERIPTAFLSVSLTEAGAENSAAPSQRRAQASADVRKMIDSFLKETGWRPTFVKAAAGALAYSKYNFLMRFVMKRIARAAGGDTDTSRDYEYTDWKALARLVDEFAPAIAEPVRV